MDICVGGNVKFSGFKGVFLPKKNELHYIGEQRCCLRLLQRRRKEKCWTLWQEKEKRKREPV